MLDAKCYMTYVDTSCQNMQQYTGVGNICWHNAIVNAQFLHSNRGKCTLYIVAKVMPNGLGKLGPSHQQKSVAVSAT